MTTHKLKREGWRRREEGGIIFLKAAHYLAVSGCMAPSQNIMMRINSPGTTSFCWRPSQGSASAFPPQTLSIFSLLSPLHHWHIGVCAMSSADGELSSSGCISPIIRAAVFSSVTLFNLPPSFALCALVKISTVSRSIFFLPLYCSLSPQHLCALPLPSSPPNAATAWPRLWFKHDGHPFEERGHHHHHLGSSAAGSALDQFNQHRKRDQSPTRPPQPWGFYISIWKVRMAGSWRGWGGVTGAASLVSASAI